MGSFMDVIMIGGFVLFMVWIIKGYHANKYEERFGNSNSKDLDDQK